MLGRHRLCHPALHQGQEAGHRLCAYFFRILDKEWSKLDSDYKYSGKRKDECYACDSLLDIYRTEVVAQAVLCGEGDVILTVEGKHPPPQWFDWLSRPDNKDE